MPEMADGDRNPDKNCGAASTERGEDFHYTVREWGNVAVAQGIYVDVLLAVNFLVDYLLLAAVQLLCGRQIQRKRLIVAAVIGAAGSLSIFLPMMGIVLRALWQFALAGVMCLFAEQWKGWRSFFCSWVTLFVMGFLMGGVLLMLAMNAGGNWLLCRNGALYLNITPLNLVATVGLGFGAVEIYQRLFPDRHPQEQLYRAELWVLGRKICCSALLDTGNQLREPFSGWPVILLERRLFPGNLPEKGLRLIPCRTVSGQAILPGIKGQKLRLHGREELEADQFYVALSEDLMGDYQLLLSEGLLNRK